MGGEGGVSLIFTFSLSYTLSNLLVSSLLAHSLLLQVSKDNARPLIPKFVNHHLQRIIDICWNADPNKRPRFEKIQPILDKLEV